jgi:hypothetical protein
MALIVITVNLCCFSSSSFCSSVHFVNTSPGTMRVDGLPVILALVPFFRF